MKWAINMYFMGWRGKKRKRMAKKGEGIRLYNVIIYAEHSDINILEAWLKQTPLPKIWPYSSTALELMEVSGKIQ